MDTVISPEAMVEYRQGARLREEQRQAGARKRRDLAWSVARDAAEVLKRQFDASRVILYGSVVHGYWFGPRSDIDLAEDGINPTDFWRAWSALDSIAQGFEINLIPLDTAIESLRQVIEQEGVEL
jgi:predicted nucleotidyltransferase